jgi:hypothetical protein
VWLEGLGQLKKSNDLIRMLYTYWNLSRGNLEVKVLVSPELKVFPKCLSEKPDFIADQV